MTSETPKLSIFQLRHRQGQRVTRPAVSLRGGSKTGPGRRWKSSLWCSQMLTFSNSLLDMSGQSQIFQINNKQTGVLTTETLSKFMDANIGANRLNSSQQSTQSPPPPHPPFRAFELHFCLYRVYCIKLTDTSIKLKRKF